MSGDLMDYNSSHLNFGNFEDGIHVYFCFFSVADVIIPRRLFRKSRFHGKYSHRLQRAHNF